MKALLLAMGAGVPAMMVVMGMAIAGSDDEAARTRALNLEQTAAARARTAALTQTPPVLAAPVAVTPLSQVEPVPEQIASARVTDRHGALVGAVQKVEIRNGRPDTVAIALLGSATLISLDAAALRYDAATNLVTTDETLAQLMARSQT